MKRKSCYALFILCCFYTGIYGQIKTADEKLVIDNNIEIKKLSYLEIGYQKDSRNCLPDIEKLIKTTYIEAGNFYRHRMNRVVRVVVIDEHMFDHDSVFTGIPEKNIRIPVNIIETEQHFLCSYFMAKSILYDLLTTSLTSSVETLYKKSAMPVWLLEGSALFFSLGADNNLWKYICSNEKHIIQSKRFILFGDNSYIYNKTGQNFCAFINDIYGPGKIADLINELKDGKSFKTALHNITGSSIDQVKKTFVKYAQSKVLHMQDEKSDLQKIHVISSSSIAQTPLFYNSKNKKLLYSDHDLSGSKIINESKSSSITATYKIKDSLIYSSPSLMRKNAAVSADGKVLAVIKQSGSGNNITVIDIEKNAMLATKYMPFRDITDISLSFNGKLITFIGGNCNISEIYTFDWHDNILNRVTNDGEMKRYPVFFKDDSKIMFSKKLKTEKSAAIYSFYLINLKNHNIEFFFNSGGNDLQPCVSRDGIKFLFISDVSGVFRTYEYSFKKHGYEKISSSEDTHMPLYAKDGKDVIFTKFDNGRYTLWQYSLSNMNIPRNTPSSR